MKTSDRILSVDIFRGLTIAAMILVNNPGSWNHVYAPLLHAEWHGLTPTDLIFPFFLFIVGMSITLAYSKRKNQGVGVDEYKKITYRTIKLIVLGLILAGFTISFPFFKDFSTLRWPGVLQRIGVVFFICALLFLNVNWRTMVVIAASILLGYYYLMTEIPVHGEPPLLTEESNLATLIDTKVLTRAHMWKEYDPEGLLSTIPAVSTTILGILFGLILIRKQIRPVGKLMTFLGAGIVLLLLGYLSDSVFPINKSLWTSSFVLVTSGWACLVFLLIYCVTDVMGKTKWGKPAIVFGSNAITVFFLSGIIARIFGMVKMADGRSIHAFLYEQLTSVITNLKLASLVYACAVIGFYYLVAFMLYRKRIFIKV